MNADSHTPKEIAGSIILGIIVSFIITYFFGIELDETLKIIITIVPPVIVSLWAVKSKRFTAVRLWSIISHGATYGFINLVAENTFFEGLESVV